ncbi:circularly permuted type 2 ATP-grasp protein [Ruminococcus sp. JE7B6]|uniref:circularly permuted type 2 ATP-grasp protein n=1 Tax=Ruminococcus sp. JE7B6 TaxID=3233380 RepID=UPI003899E561
MKELINSTETINRLLARYGVKFGIYKNGEFKEQLFPFDPIPRIIQNSEFQFLEKGLKQRVNALNCFLSDIYGDKQIVRDGVIPAEFIYSAKGFLPPCDGVMPPKNIYSHISGIDLVQSKDDSWYILEDNLRVPSGASYPMIARELQRRSAPDAFSCNSVIDNRNYAELLKEVMDYVNTGGINVILSPGRYNAACLTGIVDVYPAINPLGIDSITRGIPGFDLDMNRIFPGLENGSMPEYIASKIIDDLSGSAAVVDIHASNIFLEEIPQVRINELSRDTLVPLAKHLNVDYIWVHSSATVLESTLAYSLNVIGTPTLVVEMGVGMRITKKFGDQLTDGILALMKELGIWNGDVITPKEPIISEDGEVSFINAGKSGVFVPCVGHWKNVKKDGHIGDILNPLTGEINERILAPTDGIVFTLREYPIVNEGSLIARILA